VSVLPPGHPLTPTAYGKQTVLALRAVSQGTASESQQIRVFKYIVEEVCRTYDEPFQMSGERETNLALGKAHVGREMVKITKLSTRDMEDG